ncbi:hypothetical protein ACFLQL_02300 [Verrucomicrobiota bacterium]
MSKKPDTKTFAQWINDNLQVVQKVLTDKFNRGMLDKTLLNKYRLRKTNSKPINKTIKQLPTTYKSKPIKLARVKLNQPIDNVEYLIEPYNIDTIRNCVEACGVIDGIIRIELNELLDSGKELQELLTELLLNMSHPDVVHDTEYILLGCDCDNNLYFNVSCYTNVDKISERM